MPEQKMQNIPSIRKPDTIVGTMHLPNRIYCTGYLHKKNNLSDKTIGAAMLLHPANGPYTRWYQLNTRQQASLPFLLYFRGIPIHTGSGYGAEHRDGNITCAEQHTFLHQLIDADIHIPDTRNGIVAGFRFPERIANRTCLRERIIDLK